MNRNSTLYSSVILVLSMLTLTPISTAETAKYQTYQDERNRPKIGLVLSGGGARGAAHIGVLRVLEELYIPVDFIAGTSMGSIVGGLYASGLSVDEIESVITEIDWDGVFSDAPLRQNRSFRRKRDDDLYLVKNKLGFNQGKVEFPLGLIQGQKFNLILQKLSLRTASIHDFDDLPIPFRAIATDIGSGTEVVIGSGSLATAMRASMAVPGLFSPTEIDGRLLVDGGIVNNLPLDVAREMGADILIAVDIATPLTAASKIKNVISVTDQLIKMMTATNVARQLNSLIPDDILIKPDLGEISSADFKRASEAISAGAIAARKSMNVLGQLSLNKTAYAQYERRRLRDESLTTRIDYVAIENNSNLADRVLTSRLNINLEVPLDPDALAENLNHIYGLDVFQTVGYRLENKEGKEGVVIEATEKPWGPNYLQFGVALTGSADGDNSYNFGVSYLKTQINPLGGEWRTAIQIGESPLLFSEFYQPLSFDTRYFVTPSILYQKRNVNLFNGSNKLAEYRVEKTGFDVAIGRELGNWGEARLGVRRYTGDAEVLIGDPGLSGADFEAGQTYFRLSLDTLDNASFPRSGNFGVFESSFSRENIGSDDSYDQVSLNLLSAHSWGEHTLLFGARAESTTAGYAPIHERFTLGGFLQLSGLSSDQLSGQHTGLFRAVYYRRYHPISIMPAYLGVSLEAGNVWNDDSNIDFNSLIPAASFFMGLDTFVGPIYLGYGLAEDSRDSLFLFLGQTF